MLFKFDLSKLKVEYCFVTSVTEALGGSCNIVDDIEVYKLTGKYTSTRRPLPFAVARAYKKRTRQGRFVVPRLVAITSYEGVSVCIESASYGVEGFTSDSEYMIKVRLPQILKNEQWYTDGSTIYRLPDNVEDVSQHTKMVESGQLYAISVSALEFKTLFDPKIGELTRTKSILAFKTKKGDVILTPPVWNNVMDMRKSDETNACKFEAIDQAYMVNLDFVLTCADVIGQTWGYDKIGYLQLERYMLDLVTVNLPNVPKEVRITYDTKLSFLHSFIWLMGFIPKCENLEQFSLLRGVFKHLCKNGLFNKSVAKTSLTFVTLPPLVDVNQAKQNVLANYSDNQLFMYWTNGKIDDKKDANHGEQIFAT